MFECPIDIEQDQLAGLHVAQCDRLVHQVDDAGQMIVQRIGAAAIRDVQNVDTVLALERLELQMIAHADAR